MERHVGRGEAGSSLVEPRDGVGDIAFGARDAGTDQCRERSRRRQVAGACQASRFPPGQTQQACPWPGRIGRRRPPTAGSCCQRGAGTERSQLDVDDGEGQDSAPANPQGHAAAMRRHAPHESPR